MRFYVLLLSIVLLTGGVLYLAFHKRSQPALVEGGKSNIEVQSSAPSISDSTVSTEKAKEKNPSVVTTFKFVKVRSKQEFESVYQGRWDFQERDGRIKRIQGAGIPIPDVSSDTLRDFSNSVASLFKESDKLQFGSAFSSDVNDNAAVQVFHVDQIYQGVPVYGGQLRLNVNTQRKVITGINASDVVKIHGKLPKELPSLRTIVEKARQLDPNVSIPEPKRYVWADDQGQAHIVYEGQDYSGSPSPQSNRILVDAETGEVLQRARIAITD